VTARDGGAPFTLTDACEHANAAVGAGIVRESDGFAFAGWLADTYRDDTAMYVGRLSMNTLYGRFLGSEATR
jgi:hypothetical protein